MGLLKSYYINCILFKGTVSPAFKSSFFSPHCVGAALLLLAGPTTMFYVAKSDNATTFLGHAKFATHGNVTGGNNLNSFSEPAPGFCLSPAQPLAKH